MRSATAASHVTAVSPATAMRQTSQHRLLAAILSLLCTSAALVAASEPISSEAMAVRERIAQHHLLRTIAHAQTTFAYGVYLDVDQDGIGEYGFLNDLAGGNPAIVNDRPFLDEAWRSAYPVFDGYRFVCYLPDGERVIGPREQRSAAADGREMWFIVYAIPLDPQPGQRAFAITQSLSLFAAPAEEVWCLPVEDPELGLIELPAWDSLHGADGRFRGEPALPWTTLRE